MKSLKLYKINKQNVVFEIFEKEIVLINLENGNYYSYGGLGVDIWQLLKDPISINEILKDITNKYDKSEISALEDIIYKSITELEKENLLVQSEVNNTSPSHHINNQDSAINSELSGKKFVEPSLQKYTDMQDFLLVDPIHEVDYEKWPKKKN